MIKKLLVGIIVLIIVTLSACSEKKEIEPMEETNSKSEEVDSNIDLEATDPVELETPEGFARFEMEKDGEMVTLEQSIASPKVLPIDFTLPIPDTDIMVSGSDRYFWPNGEITYYVEIEAPMVFDELVAFYEKELQAMELTVSLDTYDPTNSAVISAEYITVKVEDVYEPGSYKVTISTDKV